MKTLIAVIMLACGSARATTFDIGPNGSDYTRRFDFGQLNGTGLNGQTVSFDLNFNNNVHLFKGTIPDFLFSFSFQTNGADNTGFATGSGYVLDSLGDRMCGTRPLASARTDDGRLFIGLFPLFDDSGNGFLATDITRPVDIYGLHLDLILPDTGLTITGGGLAFFAEDDFGYRAEGFGFRVGPHIPETGSTALLLTVGIAALLVGRARR